MSKMSWISHLCETNNRKELIEELGNTEIADGFLSAHKEMRDKKYDKAFEELNKIHNEMQKEVKENGR
jgi:adenine-specific DNA methylase